MCKVRVSRHGGRRLISTPLHHLEGKHQIKWPTTGEIAYVIDRNAVLQVMVAILSTFRELAEYVFEQLPKVSCVDFITDSYHPTLSRGSNNIKEAQQHILLVGMQLTKVP